MLRQAHYPRMVFRISRTTTVRRSPLPDVVADAYADVPPGGVVCTGLRRAAVRISGGNCLQSAIRTRPAAVLLGQVSVRCAGVVCRDAYLRLIVVGGGLWSRRWRSVVVETRHCRVSTIVWPCFCASCVPVCQSPLQRVCHLRLRFASMMPAASAAAAVAMSVAGVAVRVFTSDDDACLCSTSILTVSWRVCHRSTVLDRHRVTVSPMTTTTESLTLTLSAMATVASLSAVCAVVVAVVRCVAHDAAVIAASAAMAVTAWRIRVRRRSTGIPLSIRRV